MVVTRIKEKEPAASNEESLIKRLRWGRSLRQNAHHSCRGARVMDPQGRLGHCHANSFGGALVALLAFKFRDMRYVFR